MNRRKEAWNQKLKGVLKGKRGEEEHKFLIECKLLRGSLHFHCLRFYPSIVFMTLFLSFHTFTSLKTHRLIIQYVSRKYINLEKGKKKYYIYKKILQGRK